MMHRCSKSHGNMAAPCACFSKLFSTPSLQQPPPDMYTVDCTLSLGTPSTRLSNEDEKRRRSGSCMNNFSGWNILQTKVTTPAGGNSSGDNDPVFAHRCSNCDTTSTPLWRNGPKGPKSLCNACGIRFKKEEKRNTVTIAGATTGAGAGGVNVMDMPHIFSHHNYTWLHQQQQHHHHLQTQKMAYISNEFRFMEEEINGETDAGISFRSWRMNVTDRPSIVHDFTR